MAQYQYYLKDKTLDIYKGTKTSVYGVTTWVYSRIYSGLYAYYKQTAGSTTLESGAIKVYDATERVTFVINRLPALREETLANIKIYFNGRVYDIDRIDDYEGYTDDYKLECHYSSTQAYNGIPAVD